MSVSVIEPNLTFIICLLLAAALGAAVMYIILKGRHFSGDSPQPVPQVDPVSEAMGETGMLEEPGETAEPEEESKVGVIDSGGNDEKNRFKAKREKEFLSAFTELVEKNLSNGELDIRFIESNLNMSRSSIFRHLKATTGRSIVESIRQIRLERGKEMLGEGISVTDTAYACGFNDAGYFCRLFKKEYGLSPSQYQAMQRPFRPPK